MKVIFVHHRSAHHAENSGYGRIIDYIDGQVVYGKPYYPFKLWKFFADFHSQSMGLYDAGSVFKAIELYKSLKRNKGERSVVHFLNGERDIRYLKYFKKRFPNTKFVATFHKPPAILQATITNVSALGQLDGAVAVGVNQVEFLKNWLNVKNVVYIPHGVDTQFFKPDLTLKENNSLLFVGQHLRDFETFNNTIPELAKVIKDLKIKVVIHPAYVSKINPHPCLEILSEVNDTDLVRFYQKATLLYLPMHDSTACNSLLEAMACGLPIITSKVGGNLIYLEGTGNVLVESGNVEASINETVLLIRNEAHLHNFGKLSRKRALNMEWKTIAEDIYQFYQKLNN